MMVILLSNPYRPALGLAVVDGKVLRVLIGELVDILEISQRLQIWSEDLGVHKLQWFCGAVLRFLRIWDFLAVVH